MRFKSVVFIEIVALFLCGFAHAEVKPAKTESYKDIIEKAQNLALQKDRQQAMTILLGAIKKEGSKTNQSLELKKNLKEIGEVFFGDKAQQLYETAISLKKSDLNQAYIKINEGLKAEPDNMLLLLEQSRILMGKQECSVAEEVASKIKSLNPYEEEYALLLAQAQMCAGHMADYLKSLESVDIKRSSFSTYWNLLEVERSLRLKNTSKMGDVIAGLAKMNSANPELQYWLWKYDQLNKKKNSIAADKYLMACKNITAQVYRQYMLDPMLCRRVTEVETSGSEL